jgi:hypothetical protein
LNTTTTQRPRRILWKNVLTVVSAAILIGAEVFGAAFAGSWAIANLLGLGTIGARLLDGLFVLCGIVVMVLGPSPGALSQEEILQHELPFPPRKRSTADTAGYLLIRCLGPSLDFDHLIKRIAVRASDCIEPTAINHDTPPIAQ